MTFDLDDRWYEAGGKANDSKWRTKISPYQWRVSLEALALRLPGPWPSIGDEALGVFAMFPTTQE